MAYTKNELSSEFWLLSKGILQDSRVDTDEAKVICRWLQEHNCDATFDFAIRKIDKLLADGYIDRFESQELIEAIGNVLRALRQP